MGGGHHDVGVFAGGQGAHPVVDASDLGGVDGDGLEGRLRGQAALHRQTSAQGQVLDGDDGVVGAALVDVGAGGDIQLGGLGVAAGE